MIKLQHIFWPIRLDLKVGKFCEREQNYFQMSLHVGKDSFYPSKKVGLQPTFLEGLPYSSLTKWENFVNGNKIIFGWVYVVGTKKKPGKKAIRFAHCFTRFARYAAPSAGRGVGIAGIRWVEAKLYLLKLNSVFHHHPSVSPKQFCASAHPICTQKEGTSLFHSIPDILFFWIQQVHWSSWFTSTLPTLESKP